MIYFVLFGYQAISQNSCDYDSKNYYCINLIPLFYPKKHPG